MALEAGVGFVDILPRLNPAVFNAALAKQAGPALTQAGSTLSSKLTSGIKSLSAAVGAPVGALGAVAGVAAIGKLTLGFEDSFTRISALSNASASDIARWRDQVLTLSGETAIAPQELADALFFLSSAGLKADDVFPALEASAKAAATGLGSTSDVANITASALNAYADSGLTATDVTDTLVAAVREGRAEPDAFADALGRILPISSKAGVGFDEVTGSLAALSNIGLDVNEGVTAMRGLLQALVAPGSQAADTLAEVGISTEELRQTLSEGGLPAALALLEERTNGNIDTMRKIIPNVRALVGELGLTGENAEQVARVMEAVSNATGSAGEAFDKTSKGPGFAFRQLLNDLKNLLLAIGEAILPFGEKVVETFSSVLRPATEFLNLLTKIPGVTEAIGIALTGLIGLKVANFFRDWAASATTAATATTNLAVAEGTAVGAGKLYIANAAGVVVAQKEVAAGAETAAVASETAFSRMGKAVLPIIVVTQALKFSGETFEFFKEAFGDEGWTSALRHSAEAMRIFGINVPDLGPTKKQSDALKNSLRGVDAQLKAGAISGEDAVAKYHELADEVGIHLSDAFDTGILLQAEFVHGQIVATDITQKFSDALGEQAESAIRSGEGISKAGQKFVGFADDLGLDGQEKLAEWHEAVRKSTQDNGEAVRKFLDGIASDWRDFQADAFGSLNFAPDLLSELESTAQSARDQLAGDVSGLSSSELAKLRSDANLTGKEVLGAFRQARQDTRDFAQDLLKISRTGGEAGEDLASSFLAAGNTIGADAVANAPKKLRDSIIDMSEKGQNAADRLATRLTNSIVDPLESIKDTLVFIAEHVWGIHIPLSVTGDTVELASLVNNLAKLRTIAGVHGGGGGTGAGRFDVSIGIEGGNALGGVTRGASGFLTRGPVFQVGEAGTELVDPLESPRATRLRAQSIADALQLLGVKPSLGTNNVHVHLTVGIDDTGNLHVRRIAQDEIQRESRYRDRVPA